MSANVHPAALRLSYSISTDRRTLTVKTDEAGRAALRELAEEKGDDFGSDTTLYDAFDHLIGNSELNWIAPSECGDLTDAPILGMHAGDDELKAYPPGDYGNGNDIGRGRFEGSWRDMMGNPQSWFRPVVERWGFMSYAIRSPLEDLRDKGEAVFTAS